MNDREDSTTKRSAEEDSSSEKTAGHADEERMDKAADRFQIRIELAVSLAHREKVESGDDDCAQARHKYQAKKKGISIHY